MHKPESDKEKGRRKILRDFEKVTNRRFANRKPKLGLINKKKEIVIE